MEYPWLRRDVQRVLLSVNQYLLNGFITFNPSCPRLANKLKPSAQSVESIDDLSRLVSAADRHTVPMALACIKEATLPLTKGSEFIFARLLGDAYEDQCGALQLTRGPGLSRAISDLGACFIGLLENPSQKMKLVLAF